MQHFLHAILCSKLQLMTVASGRGWEPALMADHIPIGWGTERDSARYYLRPAEAAAMMFSLLGVISGKSEYVSVY